MRKIISVLSAALMGSALIAASAHAQGRLYPGLPPRPPAASAPAAPPPSSGGGGSAGQQGGGGGGFRGDRGDGFRRGYGGGFRGGGFYGGGFYGGGFGAGFYGGDPFFGPGFGYYDPFWWPYGRFGYPYYSYAPRTVILREPSIPAPDYLIAPQTPPPQANWYRCADPEGYYPYVRECNGQWQALPVNPQGAAP